MCCEAADLFVSKTDNGRYEINLSGAIVEGDYKQLVSLIENRPNIFVKTLSILLNSPGGSVSEAIKIAELVESSVLMVYVDEDSICASSCFLIYISGQLRTAAGNIYIHRPYLDQMLVHDIDISDARKHQRDSMNRVKDFLEERYISAEIIDKMMHLSSNESYLLSYSELQNIGFSSPTFEEVSIARCGASPEDFPTNKLSIEEASCIKNLATLARIETLKSIMGIQKTKSVFRDYLLSIGGVEQPDGRIIFPE